MEVHDGVVWLDDDEQLTPQGAAVLLGHVVLAGAGPQTPEEQPCHTAVSKHIKIYINDFFNGKFILLLCKFQYTIVLADRGT